MKHLLFIFAIGMFALTLNSCKVTYTIPLENKLKKKGAKEADIKAHVQFYVSKKIVLVRLVSDSTTLQLHGKIVIKGKQTFEVIVVPKNQKCAWEYSLPDVKDNNRNMQSQKGIIFEQAGPKYYLPFMTDWTHNDNWAINVHNWDPITQIGKVTYGGNEYDIVRGKRAILKAKKTERLKRKFKGRRTPGVVRK
jgi:hypothetical protein